MGTGLLSGQTALVTGASRGIGRALVHVLAGAGADVVGVARSGGALQEIADEVSSRGQRLLPISADLADVEEIERVSDQAWRWNGGVQVLVNCAGTIVRSEPPNVTPTQWEQVFDINARAPFFLSQSIGELMLRGEGGAIVNIASLAAEVVTGASVLYQASKAAVVQMTRGLAVRWAPKVRVNAVGPGYIRTSINEHWLNERSNERYVLDRTPLGRIGTPDDVAGAVLYLASPQSAFVTGQHLLVDGGWSAQ